MPSLGFGVRRKLFDRELISSDMFTKRFDFVQLKESQYIIFWNLENRGTFSSNLISAHDTLTKSNSI